MDRRTHPPRASEAADPAPPKPLVDDDRFIPVRLVDLVEALVNDRTRFPQVGPEMAAVASALTAVIDQETSAFERDLADRYAPFSPDRETVALAGPAGRHDSHDHAALLRRLAYLLDKANFERLSTLQVEQAVRAASTHGVVVRLNPALIESVTVWVRGRGTKAIRARTWRAPIQGALVQTLVYRRLVVVARLRNQQHVLLKLFKDIPVRDVEALLPHAEVQMSWRDRVLVFGGGTWTVWTILPKLLTASLLAISQLVWVVLVPLGMLIGRTVLGYRQARHNRTSQRTHNLYYQNLANNAGVIHSLASMIADEEVKETLLLYAFCCNARRGPATTAQIVDDELDAFLHETFGVRARFDMADADESLTRLGLWQDRERWIVVPPDVAVDRLETHWRARRSLEYHARCCERIAGPGPHAHGKK